MIYLRSTTGSDSNNGSSWALAKATLAAAATAAAAVGPGEGILVSHAHAESVASAITVAFGGTPANPTPVICVNDGTLALADTATITTTGANGMTMNGSVRGYGITCSAGTGGSSASLVFAAVAGQSDVQLWENCNFRLGAGAGGITNGTTTATAGRLITWRNCKVKFNNAAQQLRVHGCDRFVWEGGGVEAGSAVPSSGLVLAGSNGRGAAVFLSGLDLSALSSSMLLFSASSIFSLLSARNITLPAGVTETGWGVADLTAPGPRYDFMNVDNGDTQTRIFCKDYAGYLRDEAVVKRTGSLWPYSYKMVSSANVSRHGARLASPEIVIPLSAAGSPITIKADVVTDGVTLTDADAWIDIQYPGVNGLPQSVFVSDCAAINATPANQASSSATWVTTGLASPERQELAVTFTPLEAAGVVIVRVMLARASTTMYADGPRVA